MNESKLQNLINETTNNSGKNDSLPITAHSPEETIEIFTDIIIERIIEEQNRKTNV